MSWLMVFSACLVAVLVAIGVTAVIAALVVGRNASLKPADPVRRVLANMPEYPVGDDGNLKGMESTESESESEYEEANLRLD